MKFEKIKFQEGKRMTKRCRNGLLSIILLIALAVMFTPTTSMAYTNTYTRDGAVLWACARANEHWTPDLDGNGCWCVDLIFAYYQLLTGNIVWGNANDFIWNGLPSGWTRVYGDPAPGDIVVWDRGAALSNNSFADATFGHIGIVWNVYNDGTIGTVETRGYGGHGAYGYVRYSTTAACYIRPDFPPALDVKSGTSATKTTISWSADPNWDLYNLRITKLTGGSYTSYKDVWGIKNTSYSLTLPAGKYQVYVDGCKSWNPNIFAKSLTVSFSVASATPKVASATLSTSTYSYNGSARKPSVTVKNTSGKTLVNGTDYQVTYPSGRKNVGRYKVTVTFKGKYSGKKDLYFTIVPAAVTSLKADLYSYNAAKLSWKKATGATGYYIYSKKSTAKSYSLLGYVTGTACKVTNLATGTKFDYKVVPYYQPSGTNTKYYQSSNAKTVSVTTLKQISTPTVVKSGTKVKVSWNNISGETGYQISQSTSKNGVKVVTTYKTTTGKSKTISAKKRKTLYYRVRAYKQVGSTKIYGPWSAARAFKR